jgi:hypothetical protein
MRLLLARTLRGVAYDQLACGWHLGGRWLQSGCSALSLLLVLVPALTRSFSPPAVA